MRLLKLIYLFHVNHHCPSRPIFMIIAVFIGQYQVEVRKANLYSKSIYFELVPDFIKL